jgi:DNA recombination-dependent growth factor C
MAEQFDQDFAIMTLEFRGFFAALFESFGGLQE